MAWIVHGNYHRRDHHSINHEVPNDLTSSNDSDHKIKIVDHINWADYQQDIRNIHDMVKAYMNIWAKQHHTGFVIGIEKNGTLIGIRLDMPVSETDQLVKHLSETFGVKIYANKIWNFPGTKLSLFLDCHNPKYKL